MQTREHAFDISVTADAAGEGVETSYRSWFCFSVEGDAARGTPLTFTVTNCNKQTGLYKHGHRPVYRVLCGGRGASQWRRMPSAVRYTPSNGMGVVSWDFRWPGPGSHVAFAHFYPWAYADCCLLLDTLERQHGNDARGPPDAVAGAGSDPPPSDVYFARELLATSPHGRRVELLTITSWDGLLGESQETREPPLTPTSCLLPLLGTPCAPSLQQPTLAASEGRGPLAQPLLQPSWTHLQADEPSHPPVSSEEAAGGGTKGCTWRRPLCPSTRPVVFISARVHPGETPASHAMNGILDVLTRQDDPRSRRLRRMFVFKIVPMLHPDGVAEGYYRSDARGLNLNRLYTSPDPATEPSIAGAKAVAVAAGRRLFMYLDLHAHASKRGCFFYGVHAAAAADQLHNIAYVRAVALHSAAIDLGGCNFSAKNMTATDKRDAGASKDGSGRVGVYRATGVVHSYTLECNYNMSRVARTLPAPQGDGGRTSPPPGSAPASSRSSRKSGLVEALRYTPESWECVGRACLWGLLETLNAHPWSRWPSSEYKSASGALAAVWRGLGAQPDYRSQVVTSKVPPSAPHSHRPTPPLRLSRGTLAPVPGAAAEAGPPPVRPRSIVAAPGQAQTLRIKPASAPSRNVQSGPPTPIELPPVHQPQPLKPRARKPPREPIPMPVTPILMSGSLAPRTQRLAGGLAPARTQLPQRRGQSQAVVAVSRRFR